MKKIFILLLLFCFGCSKDIPLNEQQTFSNKGEELLLSISTTPEEGTLLTKNQPFFLDIKVVDGTGGRVQHLTYDLIIKKDGVETLRDSRHMMEGAPYKRSITLDKGEHMLEVSLFRGMSQEVTKIHGTQLPFTVS